MLLVLVVVLLRIVFCVCMSLCVRLFCCLWLVWIFLKDFQFDSNFVCLFILFAFEVNANRTFFCLFLFVGLSNKLLTRNRVFFLFRDFLFVLELMF